MQKQLHVRGFKDFCQQAWFDLTFTLRSSLVMRVALIAVMIQRPNSTMKAPTFSKYKKVSHVRSSPACLTLMGLCKVPKGETVNAAFHYNILWRLRENLCRK